MFRKNIDTTILYDDLYPLFDGDTKGFTEFLNLQCNNYYKEVFTKERIEKAAFEMINCFAKSGDLWLLPLMATSGMVELFEQKFKNINFLTMPCSRHPFWTVFLDNNQKVIYKSLERYTEFAEEFCSKMLSYIAYDVKRVVFFDINSTTGTDYDMLKSLLSNKVETVFYVMFNEVAKDNMNYSTGNRAKKKVAIPDEWYYTVMGYNVKYVSHLAGLMLHSSEELEKISENYLQQFPGLLRYWNTDEFMIYSKHNYEVRLGSEKAWKARLRYAQNEILAQDNFNAEYDVIRTKADELHINLDKIANIFCLKLR